MVSTSTPALLARLAIVVGVRAGMDAAASSHACHGEKSASVYQLGASGFRTEVRSERERGDHRQRAADPYHQRDDRNVREECKGKASESEPNVQDRKQHQA